MTNDYTVTTDNTGRAIQYSCLTDLYATLNAKRNASLYTPNATMFEYTNVTVEFDYEMQHTTLDDDAIALAEVEILNLVAEGVGIVPGGDSCVDLWEEEASDGTRRMMVSSGRRQEQQLHRELDGVDDSRIVLVSSKPVDVLDDAPCEILSPCTAITGIMSAVITGTDDNTAQQRIMKLIRDGMQSGQIANATNQISNLAYIGDRTFEPFSGKGNLSDSAVNQQTDSSEDDDDNTGLYWIGGIIIALLAAAVLVLGCICIRRGRKGHLEEKRQASMMGGGDWGADADGGEPIEYEHAEDIWPRLASNSNESPTDTEGMDDELPKDLLVTN